MDQSTVRVWRFTRDILGCQISDYYSGKLGETILEPRNLGDRPLKVFEWCHGVPRVYISGLMYEGVEVLPLIKPGTKPSNPKDIVGGNKVSMSCVPMNVIMEASLGLAEGMCKYGRHNYREVGVRASIYYDALMRHIADWWEGEDIDPDSGLSHVTKAISDLIVLRDSMLRDNWTDDRPPKSPKGWMQPLNTTFKEIKVKYQHMTPVHYFEVKGLK